jgi:hypothetical protein
MDDKKYTPLLPFQDMMKDGFIIYDNTTYVRDLELTDKEIINNHSDCMIKYYTTTINEPIKIGGD